jgi:hypothetical protein
VDIITNDLRCALECDQVVPFRAVIPIAALVLDPIVVASEKFTTRTPDCVALTSGSLPTLPSRITLLTDFDMMLSRVCISRPDCGATTQPKTYASAAALLTLIYVLLPYR